MFLALFLNIAPLVLATTLAVVFRKNFGKPPLGYLPYYLIYISLVVIIGDIMIFTPIRYNLWWFNIMMNGEIFFYFYLYYTLIQNKTVKKILLILISIYVVYFCVNYFILTDDWNIQQSIPFSVAYNVIILAIFWYLIEFFKTDQILKMFNHLTIWISIGLLFYTIISMPTSVSLHYLARVENINNKSLRIFTYLQLASASIMYVFYSIGILWTSRLKKTISYNFKSSI